MDDIRTQADRLTKKLLSIDKLYEQYAKGVGMTYAGLIVLEVLYNTPEGCTQKHICDSTVYSKQSVNAVIKSFLYDGLVELRELSGDRRNKLVRLTEKGRQHGESVLLPIWDIELRAVGSLTPEQRRELLRLVELCEEGFRREMGKGQYTAEAPK